MSIKAPAATGRGGDREFPLRRRQIPFLVYKQRQARISRHRLYPMSLFYSVYALILVVLTLKSAQPVWGFAFFTAGLAFWTLIEYLSHRFILHGRFPDGKGIVRQFLHRRLDPLHWEHHERPYDGLHINGTIKDLLPLFAVSAPLSFIGPLYTLPMFLAGVVQGYVVEEWVHHSVHFYNFRNPYFRYIKRHHFYHHSPRGCEKGYGLTNGFWDIVFKTRFPGEVRKALYPKAGLYGRRWLNSGAQSRIPAGKIRR